MATPPATKTAAAEVFDDTPLRIENPFVEFLRMYVRNLAAVAGFILFLIILAMAIFAPMIVEGDPFAIAWMPLSPMGVDGFLLGTDSLGRSMLVGIVHGARASLLVGAAAASITVVIGLLIGCLAGYYRGWVDEVLMRITEFFQVLPPLLLSMVLVALFEPTIQTVIFAIGVVTWPGIARLSRAEFLKIRELEYVKAARTIGAKDNRIIWRVILPNALPPLIVTAALTVGSAILFEAALSFLALGDPNVVSWGKIIGDNREYLLEAPSTVILPGLAIFVTVLAINLIGDGLNDAFNPKLRER